MADKDVSTRVLKKLIAGTTATQPAGEPENNPITFEGGEGWQSYYDATYQMWLVYNIQTIDLSGYSLQDMTLFPQGILFQDMDTLPIAEAIGAPFPVKRASIVSTVPLSLGDLNNFTLNIWHMPGSMESTVNIENILGGRMRTYLQLDTYAGLQGVANTTWGAGDSTAGSKIWYVEAFVLPSIANLAVSLPSCAVLLPSIIAEEPELEYMMRLSRSLEPVY